MPVSFGQKGLNYFGQAAHPPEAVALIASNALLHRLKAFEAIRACHRDVTGGALLTEIVVPKLAVTDICPAGDPNRAVTVSKGRPAMEAHKARLVAGSDEVDWSRRVAGLVKAARPAQWIKNLSCFAGLIFSAQLWLSRPVLRSCFAFAGFCLASSSVYLFNDICDRPHDRENPSKRTRPIASGLVPFTWALLASLALAVAALAGGMLLSPRCSWIIAIYLLLNVAYSMRLKHTVLLDVAIIAFGFVLRILFGVYAVESEPTSYIVLCMFFLALFLGFAKRRGEIHRMGDDPDPFRRPVLAKYRVPFLDMLLAMTATMSILCYSIYTVTGHQGNATLVITVPIVTYGVTRYMLLVMVYGQGESPDRLLVRDKLIIASSALWIVLCVFIIYGKIHLVSE